MNDTSVNPEKIRQQNIIRRLENSNSRLKNAAIRTYSSKNRFLNLNICQQSLKYYEEMCSMIEFCCSSIEQANTLLEENIKSDEI